MSDFKQYTTPRPKFDAYNTELGIQQSLGSDRGSAKREQSVQQSANFKPGAATGWALYPNRAYFSDITIANRIIGVSTSQELTDAITLLTEVGGGEIRLAAGTYTVTTAQALPSSIRFRGDNSSTTTITFTGSANFTMTGGSVYNTGTVSVNQGSTSVTSSGTTLAASMIGMQIFLSNRWYLISNITGTTDGTITLATAFADSNLSGSAYRISDVIKDVEFIELTIVGASTTKVIDGIDVRDLSFTNVTVTASGASGVGIELDNVMSVDSFHLTVAGVPATTSHGISITNGSFINLIQTATVSNGGSGIVLNNVKTSQITFSASNANTADGYNLTTVIDCFFIVEASGNGGQGIELVSGSNNNRFVGSNIVGNTSDGIKATATSDANLITGGTFTGNGGYGVNVAASSCDNTNITSNVFTGNSSGAVQDLGTTTLIRGNIGVADNATSSTSGSFFGTGADGALTVTSGTTTLSAGSALTLIKNYTSISITGTADVDITTPHTNGTITLLKSQGNVTVTSSTSPAIDASSMGGAGGTAGGATSGNGSMGASMISYTNYGFGYDGGDSTPDGGIGIDYLDSAIGGIQRASCGAGGGGGSQGDVAGGAGGRGGGALVILCGGALNITSTFSVAGANGSNGANGAGAQEGGGGGGGGAGGTIAILYTTLTANSATFITTGGNGGNGGTGDTGQAGHGGGGGANRVAGGAGGNGLTGAAVNGTTDEGAGGTAGTGTGDGDGGGGGGGAGGHSYVEAV